MIPYHFRRSNTLQNRHCNHSNHSGGELSALGQLEGDKKYYENKNNSY